MSTSLQYRVESLIKAIKLGEIGSAAHCANCFNTMKSGIAPQIVRVAHKAYLADQNTISGDKDKLGEFSSGMSDNGMVMVYNLYGQFGYWARRLGGMDLDYKALRSAMADMVRHLAASSQGNHIGIPKLGGGLAGGDWNVIEEIVQEELINHGFDVTVYVLNKRDIPKGGTQCC